jgi:uncharacterized Tic20 family protein
MMTGHPAQPPPGRAAAGRGEAGGALDESTGPHPAALDDGWPVDPPAPPMPAPAPAPPRSAPAAAPADPAAGSTPGPAAPEWRLAVLCYLGVPFLSVLGPLAVYLAGRDLAFTRRHAAQALNLAITVLIYNFCALLMGGVLALDSLAVALTVMIPVTAALWLIALYHLARCALAASQGGFRQVPAWLCATLVR